MKWAIKWVYPTIRECLSECALVVPAAVRRDWARRYNIPQVAVDALCEHVRDFALRELDRIVGYRPPSE